jgi:hypothetical protein
MAIHPSEKEERVLNTLRIKLSTNRYGQFYLSNNLRKALKFPDSKQETLEAIADSCAILLVPEGMKAKDALRSLDVIKKHLKHEEEIEIEETLNVPT